MAFGSNHVFKDLKQRSVGLTGEFFTMVWVRAILNKVLPGFPGGPSFMEDFGGLLQHLIQKPQPCWEKIQGLRGDKD